MNKSRPLPRKYVVRAKGKVRRNGLSTNVIHSLDFGICGNILFSIIRAIVTGRVEDYGSFYGKVP